MRKTAIAAVGMLTLSGLGVLAQQSDPIRQRQDLMKNNQEQMRALTGMARGQAPFNAAKPKPPFSGSSRMPDKCLPCSPLARSRARPTLCRSSGSGKPTSMPVRTSSNRMPRRLRPGSRIRPAYRRRSSGSVRTAAAVTRPTAGKKADRTTRGLKRTKPFSGRACNAVPQGSVVPACSRDRAPGACACVASRADRG
jgi:hypothetical protein